MVLLAPNPQLLVPAITVDSSTGVPLLRNDGGYRTTSEVAGPQGSIGESGSLSFNRLRRMERKGKSGGLLEPRRSHDDQEVGLLFHPSHRSRDRREGWGGLGGFS